MGRDPDTNFINHKERIFARQVCSRLFAIDADQITHQLLEEAVLTFNAVSGAIFLGRQEPAHATRNWGGREEISIRICGINTDFGRLALGEKRSGMKYSKQDKQLLHEVVRDCIGHRTGSIGKSSFCKSNGTNLKIPSSVYNFKGVHS
jgi:hypothetical protein